MKKGDIFQYAKSIGAKLANTQARANWVICDCPLGPWKHEKGKSAPEVFGIKVETGVSFCHCFACGFHGDQHDLVVELQMLNKIEPSGKSFDFNTAMKLISQAEQEFELDLDNIPDIEQYLSQTSTLFPFDDWWVDSFPKAWDIEFARDYLTSRGVSQSNALKHDLRADTYQKRVCAPVCDFKGTYRGLHGRAVDDDAELRYRMYTYKKHNNPIVWYGEQWVDFDRPVITCEGYFDVLSIRRVYDNVISPLYASPNLLKMKRMAGAHEWITFLDHGAGGDAGRLQYDKAFAKDHIVQHVTPPDNRKDPGACTVKELKATLHGLVDFVESGLA